jgi:hypothetical protein
VFVCAGYAGSHAGIHWGERKTFFNDLRAVTRYMVFDSWDDLFRFMEEGLEIAPVPP